VHVLVSLSVFCLSVLVLLFFSGALLVSLSFFFFIACLFWILIRDTSSLSARRKPARWIGGRRWPLSRHTPGIGCHRKSYVATRRRYLQRRMSPGWEYRVAARLVTSKCVDPATTPTRTAARSSAPRAEHAHGHGSTPVVSAATKWASVACALQLLQCIGKLEDLPWTESSRLLTEGKFSVPAYQAIECTNRN
jgi:hypothetical protein